VIEPADHTQSTLVLQSHRLPLPHPWLGTCLDSVRDWAKSQGYDYRFVGDELFELLSLRERRVCRTQPVVASDLARLRLCQHALREGVDRVVWCDADSLVIAPENLILAAAGCAFGRELWLQQAPVQNGQGSQQNKQKTARSRLYKKIHNAFMQFSSTDPVLDFYEYAATRMLARHALTGGNKTMVAQLLGPKFLSLLHNVVEFQVLEHAQVVSPLLAEALLKPDARLLERYRGACHAPAAVVNLCASEVLRGNLSDELMQRLIDVLRKDGIAVSPVGW